MEIEKQVCSLELAKRLKDIGVKQESLFQWCDIDHHGGMEPWLYYGKLLSYPETKCSAFTVAELGEYLQWEKLYIFGIPKELLDYVDCKNTEADARAQMLIYLIDNNLIKL